MNKKIFMFIFALLFTNSLLFAQDAKQNNKKEASISIGGSALSLEQAIDIVIKQNLTLQSAKYDIVMSDTAYEKAQKKYATNLNLEGGYMQQELPPSKTTALTGTKQWQYDAGISLSKIFSTGTTISAGVKEVFFDANDPTIPWYNTGDYNPATNNVGTGYHIHNTPQIRHIINPCFLQAFSRSC